MTASPYEYVSANPVKLHDPLGEQEVPKGIEPQESKITVQTPDEIGRTAHRVFAEYMTRVSGASGNWLAEKQISPGVSLRPDLLYFGGSNNPSKEGSVWELKPVSNIKEPAHSSALVQVGTYALAANMLKLGGLTWDIGTSNGNPKPFDVPTLTLKNGDEVFNFFIKNPEEGLIYYTSNIPRQEPQPKTVPTTQPVTEPKTDLPLLPILKPPVLQPGPTAPKPRPVPVPIPVIERFFKTIPLLLIIPQLVPEYNDFQFDQHPGMA